MTQEQVRRSYLNLSKMMSGEARKWGAHSLHPAIKKPPPLLAGALGSSYYIGGIKSVASRPRSRYPCGGHEALP